MLERQNIEAATGAFGENHDNAYQYTMKYRGRYSTPEEFGELATFVQEYSGIDETLQEKVDEAKN